MRHPVVQGSEGHPVGEKTLQAHKHHPGRKRDAGPHIVEGLGMVNLKDREETQTISLVVYPKNAKHCCRYTKITKIYTGPPEVLTGRHGSCC